MHALHRRMCPEIGRDLGRVLGRAHHAQRQRLQRAAEHPAGMGIELRADGGAQRLDRADRLEAAQRSAGDQVGMAADIFGQRIDRDIGPLPERLLEDGSQQRVVADHDRAPALLPFADLLRHGAHQRHVDQRVQWVRRRLDHDHRDPALRLARLRCGGAGRAADRLSRETVREADAAHAEARERLRDQRLRAPIERLRMQDHVARPRIGQDRGRDRRHAGAEEQPRLGALVDGEPILDDLAVGMVEARIDEPRRLARRCGLASRDHVEELLAVLGGLEQEGRGQEDRRLHRALGEHRIVAVAQHQRLGMQAVVADPVLQIAGLGHGRILRWREPELARRAWRDQDGAASAPSTASECWGGGHRSA